MKKNGENRGRKRGRKFENLRILRKCRWKWRWKKMENWKKTKGHGEDEKKNTNNYSNKFHIIQTHYNSFYKLKCREETSDKKIINNLRRYFILS